MNIYSLTSCAVALAWTSVGLATPPEIVTFTIVDDFPVVDCGEFEVWTEAPTRITEKTFFNQSGQPVRLQVHGRVLESVYYNRSNPELFVSQGAKGVGEGFSNTFDLITGEITNSSGNFFRLTLPGIGHVLMSVGHFGFDADGNFVFHGLEALADGETGLALCEALSP
jgi:hypothetical protein